MNESPFESVEEQLLRIFPRLRRTAAALASIPDDQQPAADGSTAVHVPRPVPASTVKSGLECQICLELTADPVVSLCQGRHLYCRSCFDKWVKLRPVAQRFRCCTLCPDEHGLLLLAAHADEPIFSGILCRDPLKDPSFSRVYKSAVVACPKEGCDWEGPLEEYRCHGASCARRTVLESLGEKLEQTRAELEQAQAERDEARLERDEARAERDLLSCKVRRMQEKDDGAAAACGGGGGGGGDDDSSDASWVSWDLSS